MPEGCRVLVVEDDGAVRTALVDLLCETGYQVVEAATGGEAFGHLQQPELPCLLVLDLMMPGMTGWELLQRVRQQPAVAHLPVIIVSAVADYQLPSRLPGAVLLPKPMTVSAVLAAVAAACPVHHGRAEDAHTHDHQPAPAA